MSVVLAVAVSLIVSAFAFVGDQLDLKLGLLGTELQQAVKIAGEAQIIITTNDPQDLIRQRDEIVGRLVRVVEQSDRISQALSKMKDNNVPLLLANLTPDDKLAFERLLSNYLRHIVVLSEKFDVETATQVYSGVSNGLVQNIREYEIILTQLKGVPSIFTLNQIGFARANLTISIGQLVEYSGYIQRLAYVQPR